jgi:hypothetical protein
MSETKAGKVLKDLKQNEAADIGKFNVKIAIDKSDLSFGQLANLLNKFKAQLKKDHKATSDFVILKNKRKQL